MKLPISDVSRILTAPFAVGLLLGATTLAIHAEDEATETLPLPSPAPLTDQLAMNESGAGAAAVPAKADEVAPADGNPGGEATDATEGEGEPIPPPSEVNPSLFPDMPDGSFGPAGELGLSGGEGTPTESVVINLINLLVQRGVLTQGDAAGLISQAEIEAETARQQSAAIAEDNAMASDDDIVVTHIPDSLKAQLRVDIKRDIFEQAMDEKWAAPYEIPDWAQNTSFFGDLRFRYDGTIFPEGNDTTGSFPNFHAINSGDPFDIAGFDFSPQLNVDEERHRYRLRARIGTEVYLGDKFTAGMRVGTGSSDSPVSTNQTLGSDFSKYQLWLDRAYLKWQSHDPNAPEKIDTDPYNFVEFMVGRFDNPFFASSQIMWDSDLGFDGLALRASKQIKPGITPFFNGGIFPIYNTEFDFATNNPDKFESTDKWIYGTQLGVDLMKGVDLAGKIAVGYFEFDNVEGELSDPFLPFSTKDQGNTDHLRPTFAQKGNTYRPLRNIIADPLNGFGTAMQYQYYGLASQFEVLNFNGRVDWNVSDFYQVSLLGEFATNLAFDADKINQFAVNNRGPITEEGTIGGYEGGGDAWMVELQFGSVAMEKIGDWNAALGYRYVESDAFIDGLTDSDFGLGGTNMEGITLSTGFALSPKVFLNLRWMSANEIAGPPLKSDIIQFDVNAKF